jgi:DNA-binding NtrC family response regulator
MSATILIIDDEEDARFNYKSFLTRRGYEIIDVATLAAARVILQQGRADIILLDVELPDGYGLSLLPEAAQLPNRPPVIVITGFGRIEMAVEAMNNGAHYFLEKPIKFEELEKRIESALEIVAMRRELNLLRNAQSAEANFIIGNSPTMKQLVNIARRAASVRASVLITGETGTGKEMLARAIHRMVPTGGRNEGPFIGINCAAIQPTLLESELFGYEPGAFSGAEKRKLGLMEQADGGVLFLDEVSSMPLEMQAKLLRALDERAFYRVGGNTLIHIDVQILAATNHNLKEMIEKGEFRSDLYYRLKVIELYIPSLKERKQDIPELVGLFIRQINMQSGQNIQDVTPKAMEALMAYNWPGNIRELRNTIERAMLFCDDACIDICHLPMDFNGPESLKS